MRHPRLFPLLFLLLSILVDVSSSLSFNIHFSHWGYDPQEILFHQTTSSSPKNTSFFHGNNGSRMYTGHHDRRVVLRRKKRKNFVPKTCDCSGFDGLMYARPVLLRDEATDEVASFKMTLCLRVDDMNRAGASSSSNHGGEKNLIGMFMFLVPYPWNRSDKGIEFGLDSTCSSLGDDQKQQPDPAVVCAHVHYDSAEELLKTNVRAGGGRSCVCASKIDRRRKPKEAAVGLASRIAGDPIKLGNILTWSFYSTLESKDPPLLLPPPDAPTGGGGGGGGGGGDARGEQRLRLDPWNRNAELNLRYQRNWQQLRCSISVTLGCGNNANEDMDLNLELSPTRPILCL